MQGPHITVSGDWTFLHRERDDKGKGGGFGDINLSTGQFDAIAPNVLIVK